MLKSHNLKIVFDMRNSLHALNMTLKSPFVRICIVRIHKVISSENPLAKLLMRVLIMTLTFTLKKALTLKKIHFDMRI